MKPNIKGILERCIEDGIARGYQQAHKHTGSPSQGWLVDAISAAIWLEIDCYFDFEETTSD